jgi:hypothetical protein
MGQLGFFDLNRRYECLIEKNDPLVAIAAMVPFEFFRPKLHAALIKGELRRSKGAAHFPRVREAARVFGLSPGRDFQDVPLFRARLYAVQAVGTASDPLFFAEVNGWG